MVDDGGGVFAAGADGAGAGGVEEELGVLKPEGEDGFVLVAGCVDDVGDDLDVAGVEGFGLAVGDFAGAGELVAASDGSVGE